MGFRTSSIVWILKNYKIKTRRFGNWISFRPQVTGLRLALSKGPNRVGVSPQLRTETDPVSETSCFTLYFFRIQTMDEVRKPINSADYTNLKSVSTRSFVYELVTSSLSKSVNDQWLRNFPIAGRVRNKLKGRFGHSILVLHDSRLFMLSVLISVWIRYFPV
jgi:hypothetical protein